MHLKEVLNAGTVIMERAVALMLKSYTHMKFKIQLVLVEESPKAEFAMFKIVIRSETTAWKFPFDKIHPIFSFY